MRGDVPTLYIIVPCYNEQEVLPQTAPLFLAELDELSRLCLASDKSRIVFVDDGSSDDTWQIICALSGSEKRVLGLRQSRNRGHQNAVWAGLCETRGKCDAAISIDCDGQDDIAAMERMLKEYAAGFDIVYGVRSSRKTDGFFKRATAEAFYKLLNSLGAQVVFNHADYRLVSSRVLDELQGFREVNLFLRGLFPLVGFKSTSVPYERHERLAGKSKYPLGKMIALAVDGITSLSVKPLHLISWLGITVSVLSFAGALVSVVQKLLGMTVAGWASTTCVICFVGGVQLVSLGIIGEYVGKIYMEVKDRPRYIIAERCGVWSYDTSGGGCSPLTKRGSSHECAIRRRDESARRAA